MNVTIMQLLMHYHFTRSRSAVIYKVITLQGNKQHRHAFNHKERIEHCSDFKTEITGTGDRSKCDIEFS